MLVLLSRARYVFGDRDIILLGRMRSSTGKEALLFVFQKLQPCFRSYLWRVSKYSEKCREFRISQEIDASIWQKVDSTKKEKNQLPGITAHLVVPWWNALNSSYSTAWWDLTGHEYPSVDVILKASEANLKLLSWCEARQNKESWKVISASKDTAPPPWLSKLNIWF